MHRTTVTMSAGREEYVAGALFIVLPLTFVIFFAKVNNMPSLTSRQAFSPMQALGLLREIEFCPVDRLLAFI